MNLFELFIKIGVDDEASNQISQISSSLGNGLKTAAKIGTAAVTGAASGIAFMTKTAIDGYAEFEQLVGGAELMFGNAFQTVQNNAKEAYKTVQMSQNEYLQQVNGFATGLKTALGGNEEAAADLAHKIIVAEADVIAATGNTAENVQNAFNGIMKSNFTMLDNLQLGITPTKEGFQEVIDKVNEWNKANGEATNYQMGNLADMQSALVDYIEMQGLAGYAADEAAGTISGSLSMMKSAWTNLVTGVADDNADFDALIGDFIESAGSVAENLLPRVSVALDGFGRLVQEIMPEIVDQIPALIDEYLPKMLESGVSIVISIAKGLLKAVPGLIDKIPEIVSNVVNAFSEHSGEFLQIGVEIVKSIWNGIGSMLEWAIDKVSGFFSGIVDGVKNFITGGGKGTTNTVIGTKSNMTTAQAIGGIVGANGTSMNNNQPIEVHTTITMDSDIVAEKTYRANQRTASRHGVSLVK